MLRGGLRVRAPYPFQPGHQALNTKPALPRREDGPGVSGPGFRAGGQAQGTWATMGSHHGPAPFAPTARMRMLMKLPEGRSLKVWLACGGVGARRRPQPALSRASSLESELSQVRAVLRIRSLVAMSPASRTGWGDRGQGRPLPWPSPWDFGTGMGRFSPSLLKAFRNSTSLREALWISRF